MLTLLPVRPAAPAQPPHLLLPPSFASAGLGLSSAAAESCMQRNQHFKNAFAAADAVLTLPPAPHAAPAQPPSVPLLMRACNITIFSSLQLQSYSSPCRQCHALCQLSHLPCRCLHFALQQPPGCVCSLLAGGTRSLSCLQLLLQLTQL